MATDGSIKISTELDSKKAEKAMSRFSSYAKTAMAGVKTAIVTGSAAITAMAGYSVKVGSDFEAAMSKVSAISGATGDDLQKLTEKAKEMGAKTKFSATESAQAFEYMAMAGWKTDDMLNGIEGIMNLAAASGEDLATTSDIVTDALTAMGLQASDSGHFADVLAAASSNSNTNVGMMGETFKYVAPVAGVRINNKGVSNYPLTYLRKAGSEYYTKITAEIINGFLDGTISKKGNNELVGFQNLLTNVESIKEISLVTNNLFKTGSKVTVLYR